MNSPADLLTPAAVATLLLLGCRVGGVLLIAPVFSTRTVPMSVRVGLMIVLTWLLVPAALGVGCPAPATSVDAVLGETLVGFAIGLGAAVLVGAAEAAGELLAIHVGLSGASVLDPLNQQSVPVLGQFMSLFAVTLLLTMNAHVGMLEAISASVRYLPLGGPFDLQHGLAAMVSLGSRLFVLGLRFAAPVVATVLLANVALAVLTRTAPALNVLSVAFPLQIGVGLFALVASLPLIATFFAEWGSSYDEVLSFLLRALSGAGAR